MPVTMSDVRAWLDCDEVDYGGATKLGPASIPFLMELVQGGDLNLASKATYLASLIKSKKSLAVLQAAAAKNEPLLRVAAASGIRNLPESQAEKVLNLLTTDPDAGIRKVALKSAAGFTSPRIAAKLREMARKDEDPFVRQLAENVTKKAKKKK